MGTDGDIAWITVAGTEYLAIKVNGLWYRMRPSALTDAYFRDQDVAAIDVLASGITTTV